ncbi:MAG: helix-turn-helix transcriptional regulator [Rikenellaceae bacterium]|nr:helix-turn-helix transcriptional regulator [Rikenellaceae bacterium]
MKREINIKFGQSVAKIRNSQHLSQEELADKCGLHRTYIGIIERGEKSPTLETMNKIAIGLGVSLKDLL